MKNSFVQTAFFLLSFPIFIQAQFDPAPVEAGYGYGFSYSEDEVAVRLVKIDKTSGDISIIGNLSPYNEGNIFMVRGLAIDAQGVIFGLTDSNELFKVDAETAQYEIVGPLGIGPQKGLAIDDNGMAWSVDWTGSGTGINTVNLSTGSGTALYPNALPGSWHGGIAFNQDDGLLYILTDVAGKISTVDPNTGIYAELYTDPSAASFTLGDIFFDKDGDLFATGDSSNQALYKLNMGTGLFEKIADYADSEFVGGINSADFSPLEVVIEPLEEVPFAYFSLDDCFSQSTDDSGIDYSEFVADPTYSSDCGNATVSGTLHRENPSANGHSCTDGVEGSTAMCVGSLSSCENDPGNEAAIVFELDLNPSEGSEMTVTKLSFYEAAPEEFSWIDGASGPNNYPTLYSVRVLVDDTEVFAEEDIPTTTDYTLEEFDFTSMDGFAITGSGTARVELLGYCPIGIEAPVSAWDIDEIRVYGTCGPPASEFRSAIAGKVVTENGVGVSQVSVTNSSVGLAEYPITVITGEDGAYAFPSNPDGYDYTIAGIKEKDILDGVSTLDIVLIMRHILKQEDLDSPYKLVAADINNDGEISSIDLVELRKTILGFYPKFPDNPSWKFVDPSFEMSMLPPVEYRESMELKNLYEDKLNVDLVGIKTGDVNNSNATADKNNISVRSAAPVNFNLSNTEFRANNRVYVTVTSDNFSQVAGFQLSFEMQGLDLVSMHPGALDVNTSHYNVVDGNTLLMSWNALTSIDAEPHIILFTLEFIAKKSGLLSESIANSSHALANEAYLGADLSTNQLNINFSEDSDHEIQLFQNNPNPFAEQTEIIFYLPQSSHVMMTVTDLSGKRIFQESRSFEQGLQTINLSNTQLEGYSGVLLFNLFDGNTYAVIKMIKI